MTIKFQSNEIVEIPLKDINDRIADMKTAAYEVSQQLGVIIANCIYQNGKGNNNPFNELLDGLSYGYRKQIDLWLSEYYPQARIEKLADEKGKLTDELGVKIRNVKKLPDGKQATILNTWDDVTQLMNMAASVMAVKSEKKPPVKKPYSLSKELERLLAKAKKSGCVEQAQALRAFCEGKGYILPENA